MSLLATKLHIELRICDDYAMWILKGTMLGLWVLGFGTMAWLYFVIYHNLPPNSAVEIRVITGYTVQDPVWWAALAVLLAPDMRLPGRGRVLQCCGSHCWSLV